jgi:membrane fusion protein (multidrug efflux system)
VAFRDEALYDVLGLIGNVPVNRAPCPVGVAIEESQRTKNMMPPPATARTIPSRLILLFTGSVATTALGLAGCRAYQQPEHQPKPPKVTVTRSERRTLPIVVNPIGTTRALQDVTIRARVKGFLTEKHFDEGHNVKKGQLLLVIDEEPYKLQLAQTKAQLEAYEAALKRAEASRKPQVAKAQLDLDNAQLLLDRVEERRERSLLLRKAASQDDYDKADAQLKKTGAQVEADRASLEQEEADYKINIETAKADVARAEAAVEDARLNLGYCRMIAPIAGRIGELKVKVGNLVGDGQATELVTIQQLDPMGLDFRPPARHLPVATALLRTGLKVELIVEGERRHPHVGKAIFIDNVVDTTTSTFLVRAEVPNPDGSLLPGEYVRAGMIVGEYVDAVVVPEQAVIEGQEGSRVYVIGAANKVQVAKVKPVDVYEGLRVLEAGLESGQEVVVEGIQLVRPEQVVEPHEVPLEKYVRAETSMTTGDQRFNSGISRVPGLEPDARPRPTTPAPKESPPGQPR